MPHGRVSAELCLLKATRCPPVPRTPCSLQRGLGLSRPCRPQLWCRAWHRVPPVGFLVPSGHPEAGREPIAAARGQPGSQALGFPLGTGSSLGLHLCFCTWCRGWTPLSSEEPGHGGLGSPVLLPRVTPAGVGLPQLGGEHPDDVDEEDEVELWERGRTASRGCSPAGRGARTRGPMAPPGLCSAAASPGGSLGPQVPHLDQDGDRLPLRPCG